MAAPTASPLSPMATSGFGQLGGPDKRKDIEEILQKLEQDNVRTNILPPIRNEILERLKLHTTAIEDLEPLLTQRGVSILCHQGFDGASPTTRRIAERCLCNIMLFSEQCRQFFVDEGYPKEAAEQMKDDNREDELLSARILFLCTYNTNLDFDPIFEKNALAETITTNLARHAKLFTKTAGKTMPPPQAVSSCVETLKLLYNLTNFYPHQTHAFSKCILPILKMIKNCAIPTPPLQPPLAPLINALIHLDIEDKKERVFTINNNPMFPTFDANVNVERLVHILDVALSSYSDEEMDKNVAPLAQVLLRIAEFAPPPPKAKMRVLLLPSDKDREKVLGQGDSLPARLLRLSAAPLAPNLRQHVPALLFELSDKDARRFVRNVGYGFAAGFLVSNGVQIPSSALEAWSTGEADEGEITNPSRRGSKATTLGSDQELLSSAASVASGNGGTGGGLAAGVSASLGAGEGSSNISSSSRHPVAYGPEPPPPPVPPKDAPRRAVEVNPITGQRRDMEPTIPEGPPMSEEEKMREAERMFVLFERLRATGVVDVENPVAKAAREGRFEELE